MPPKFFSIFGNNPQKRKQPEEGSSQENTVNNEEKPSPRAAPNDSSNEPLTTTKKAATAAVLPKNNDAALLPKKANLPLASKKANVPLASIFVKTKKAQEPPATVAKKAQEVARPAEPQEEAETSRGAKNKAQETPVVEVARPAEPQEVVETSRGATKKAQETSASVVTRPAEPQEEAAETSRGATESEEEEPQEEAETEREEGVSRRSSRRVSSRRKVISEESEESEVSEEEEQEAKQKKKETKKRSVTAIFERAALTKKVAKEAGAALKAEATLRAAAKAEAARSAAAASQAAARAESDVRMKAMRAAQTAAFGGKANPFFAARTKKQTVIRLDDDDVMEEEVVFVESRRRLTVAEWVSPQLRLVISDAAAERDLCDSLKEQETVLCMEQPEPEDVVLRQTVRECWSSPRDLKFEAALQRLRSSHGHSSHLWVDAPAQKLVGDAAGAFNTIQQWLTAHWLATGSRDEGSDDSEESNPEEDDYAWDDDSGEDEIDEKRATLLSGPCGVGKTACAHAAASAAGFVVLEIDASRGLSPKELKDDFLEATRSARLVRGGTKKIRTLLLVDDVDGYTLERDPAFSRALKKLLRDARCPVIVTTSARNIAAMKLGCARHLFLGALDAQMDLAPHLETLLSDENKEDAQTVCRLIAESAKGDARRATNALQVAILGTGGSVEEQGDAATPPSWVVSADAQEARLEEAVVSVVDGVEFAVHFAHSASVRRVLVDGQEALFRLKEAGLSVLAPTRRRATTPYAEVVVNLKGSSSAECKQLLRYTDFKAPETKRKKHDEDEPSSDEDDEEPPVKNTRRRLRRKLDDGGASEEEVESSQPCEEDEPVSQEEQESTPARKKAAPSRRRVADSDDEDDKEAGDTAAPVAARDEEADDRAAPVVEAVQEEEAPAVEGGCQDGGAPAVEGEEAANDLKAAAPMVTEEDLQEGEAPAVQEEADDPKAGVVEEEEAPAETSLLPLHSYSLRCQRVPMEDTAPPENAELEYRDCLYNARVAECASAADAMRSEDARDVEDDEEEGRFCYRPPRQTPPSLLSLRLALANACCTSFSKVEVGPALRRAQEELAVVATIVDGPYTTDLLTLHYAPVANSICAAEAAKEAACTRRRFSHRLDASPAAILKLKTTPPRFPLPPPPSEKQGE